MKYDVKAVVGGEDAVFEESQFRALLTPSAEHKLVLVCAKTRMYRRFARNVPLWGMEEAGTEREGEGGGGGGDETMRNGKRKQKYVEVGCSYGVCTAMLAKRAAKGARRGKVRECEDEVIGLDISREVVEAARARYLSTSTITLDQDCNNESARDIGQCQNRSAHIRFEVCDALERGDLLLEYATGATHVFIDIAGTRDVQSVVRLIDGIMKLIEPAVMVVKSSRLLQELVDTTSLSISCTDCLSSFAISKQVYINKTNVFWFLRSREAAQYIHDMHQR